MKNKLLKWLFYSSISLPGSRYPIQIRIQPGDWNPNLQHCIW